jgi:hypothetical protein
MNFGFLQIVVKLYEGIFGREATLFNDTNSSCPLSVPLRPFIFDICTMSGFETQGLLFPSSAALDSMTVTFKLKELGVFCAK